MKRVLALLVTLAMLWANCAQGICTPQQSGEIGRGEDRPLDKFELSESRSLLDYKKEQQKENEQEKEAEEKLIYRRNPHGLSVETPDMLEEQKDLFDPTWKTVRTVTTSDADIDLNAADRRLILGQSKQLLSARTSIGFALPLNDTEYRNVYGVQKVTLNNETEMRRASAAIERTRSSQLRSAHSLDKFLSSDQATFIFFVGHNESGSFKFLDGTSLTIPSLIRKTASYNKLPIIISCSATDYFLKRAKTDEELIADLDKFKAVPVLGTSGSLTFAESVSIAEQLASFIEHAAGGVTSLDQFRSHMSEIETTTKRRLRYETIAMKVVFTAGAIIMIGIMISLVKDEKHKQGLHPSS